MTRDELLFRIRNLIRVLEAAWPLQRNEQKRRG